MLYCPNCKVSLAPGSVFCPLCRARVVESLASGSDETASVNSNVSWSGDVRNADTEEHLSPAEKRIMAFELMSVSIGIALAVTLGLDFFLSGSLTWSRFSSLVLIMVYLCVSMPLVLWGHFWLVFSVLGPSLLLSLFLWALFGGDFSWFFIPALPIAIVFEGIAVSSITLIRVMKRKGLNVIGIVLAASAFLCAGIDCSLSLYHGGPHVLSWSVIVLMAVIPVSGFFFYLHYRVMRRASLRKLFRL